MKEAKVVIGSAYGDEGKGVFTDYWSSRREKSLVIRFNGGSQAGHTVVTPEGKRHVFGHFTSNSFLPDSQVVLSQFFVVNPLLFLKEKKVLNSLGVNPKVFVHEDCYVTTPFEMLLNQWLETSRGSARHGSCGVGFGETIEREESSLASLRMKDFLVGDIYSKIMQVRDYFIKRVSSLNLDSFLNDNSFAMKDFFIEKFIADFCSMGEQVSLYRNLPESENIVFEGAQGLLLDQQMGYFPYVTRSNTGLKNVVSLAKEYGIGRLNVTYATRCYTTRHGAGPLNNQLEKKPYENIVDETNIHNEYQGTIRFSYLDLNLLKNTIDRDLSSVEKSVGISWGIGISCLDQTEEVFFYEDNELKCLGSKQFGNYVQEKFNVSILESWRGNRDFVLAKNS